MQSEALKNVPVPLLTAKLIVVFAATFDATPRLVSEVSVKVLQALADTPEGPARFTWVGAATVPVPERPMLVD